MRDGGASAATGGGPSWDELDALLRERVADLVADLRGQQPNKALSTKTTRKYGNKGSLSVEVAGRHQGRITDWEGDGKGMSPLAFIRAERGGEWRDALAFARSWLGLDRGEVRPAPNPRQPRQSNEQAAAEAAQEAAARRAKAAEIAAQTVPLIGAAAESYLMGRAITIAGDLAPDVVAYNPRAWGYLPGYSGPRYGALVMIARNAAGDVQAVQQVYVTAEGRKAPLAVQKRTIGSMIGAAVKLPRRLDCLPALARIIILCEGPETALSVWQATGAAVWCVLGGSNFSHCGVPAGVEVIIAADADPPGTKAIRSLQKRVEELVSAGYAVRVARPVPYVDLKKTDFNDTLQRSGVDAIRRAILGAGPLGDGPFPPYYPSAPLSTGDAAAEVQRAVSGWVLRAVGHFEGWEDPPQLGIRGAAGLGKTEAVIRALAASPEIEHLHAEVYCPDHKLTGEWAERLSEAAPHLRVQIIRGRDHVDDEGSLCARADAAAEIAKNGFSVVDHLCRRVIKSERDDGEDREELCPHYARCKASRYLSQFASSAPAVRILPHEYLGLPRPNGQPEPDLVIIDERFWAVARQVRSFGLDRLVSARRVDLFGQDATADVADVMVWSRVVHDALLTGKPLLAALRKAGITAGDLKAAARVEWGGVENIPVSPGMTDEEIRKRLSGFQRSEAAKLYRLWKTLETEIATGRDGAHGVELRRDVPVPGGKNERQDRIWLHWRRNLRVGSVPALVIDADLDEEIARLFLPHIDVIEIQAERVAEVVQVHDTACSKQRLLGAGENDRARAGHRRADVLAMVEAEAFTGRKVLVVATKAVRCALTGEEMADKLPTSCTLPFGTVEVVHFGAIRGQDRWRDFDSVFIVGREQPPPLAIEEDARALWFDRDDPLTFLEPDEGGRSRLAIERRGFRMRHGLADGEVDIHPDPDIQRVLEQRRERESAQAIDRLRLVHAARPKTVFILSNLVLDVTVDRLVSWSELVPCRIETALHRAGAVPLSCGELARCFPALWSSPRAVKGELERAGLNRLEVLYNYLIGKRSYLIRCEYRRPAQRGRATQAIVAGSPGMADEAVRAVLERLVGEVAEFRIIERCGASKPAPVVASVASEPAPSNADPEPDGGEAPAGGGPPPKAPLGASSAHPSAIIQSGIALPPAGAANGADRLGARVLDLSRSLDSQTPVDEVRIEKDREEEKEEGAEITVKSLPGSTELLAVTQDGDILAQ
jgi:putative DNA primase/helicase